MTLYRSESKNGVDNRLKVGYCGTRTRYNNWMGRSRLIKFDLRVDPIRQGIRSQRETDPRSDPDLSQG